MFTTTQVAEVLGITSGRARQMVAHRAELGSESIAKLPLVDQLAMIPEPVNSSPALFDPFTVYRTRAYRAGGAIARRVELAAWEDHAAHPSSALRILEFLQYPANDPKFVTWLMDTINSEVAGVTS